MAGKSLTHSQGKGSLSHNNRKFNAKNVDSSRTRDNVTFTKIPIKQAYEECFGDAVERYNAKQKRSDRKIKDGYFQYAFDRKPCDTVVTAADKRKSFYEDIVQIGTREGTGVGSVDAETAKQCLTEYMAGFAERSPNFFVFNAVLHMDEATPHLHIDYIPIAHCKRGLDTQNGMAMALKEMGFGEGKDAISRWRESERKVLTDICKRHGIEIAPPEKARGSFEVEEFKRYKDNIAALKKETQAAEKQLEELNGKILSAQELKAIEGKKSIGGALKNVSWEEWQSVKNTAEYVNRVSVENSRLKEENIEAAENLRKAVEKEQANTAREQRLNQMSAEIVSLREEAEDLAIEAQRERDQFRELRKKQEGYIRGTAQQMAQKIADKRIESMFEGISDKRGKRLEEFCQNLKCSDGTNALQAFEKQEQALKARSKGRGR